MEKALLIALACAIVLVSILRPMLAKRKAEGSGGTPDTDPERAEEEAEPEMETRFFERVRDGAAPYRVAAVYSQFDVMFLKSLLQSAGIPYRFEYEHLSKIRTGLPVENYNDTKLDVLDEDYADAIAVIEDFEANKAAGEPEKTGRLRNIAELAVGGWVIPPVKERTILIYRKEADAAGRETRT